MYGAPALGKSAYYGGTYYGLTIKKRESKVFADDFDDDQDSYESFSTGALIVTTAFVQRIKDLNARNELMDYAENFFVTTNVLANSLVSILGSCMLPEVMLLRQMVLRITKNYCAVLMQNQHLYL